MSSGVAFWKVGGEKIAISWFSRLSPRSIQAEYDTLPFLRFFFPMVGLIEIWGYTIIDSARKNVGENVVALFVQSVSTVKDRLLIESYELTDVSHDDELY